MTRTKLPTELCIQIAAYLEPDACYRLTQALDGLDLLLAHEYFARGARRTGDTIVYLAASKGDQELMQTMLTRAVNFQVRNKHGVTPLSPPAHRGHKAIVDLLISAGANSDEQDNRGLTTPLHGAAYHGSDVVVQVLLDAGANPYRLANRH
jgi:ankyrin repeat protein